MAKVTIFCGSDSAGGKRELLAKYCGLLTSGSPSSVLWLAPTYRSLQEVRRQLLIERHLPVAPNVWTFQEFADEIVCRNDPVARPISHLHRRLLIDEVVTRMSAQGKLPLFHGIIETYGFSETIFSLIGELKQHDVSPTQLLNAINDRRSSSLDENAALEKHHQCALIYEEYQRLLDRHSWYDLEGRVWHARDLLRQNRRRPVDQVTAVFLHGFAGFTKTQSDILRELFGWVQECWITLPHQDDPQRSELFGPARQSLSDLSDSAVAAKSELNVRYLNGPAESKPLGISHLQEELFRPLREVQRSENAEGIDLIEAPGNWGEARLIARRIKELLHEGVSADDVLVVAREVSPTAELIQEVFQEYQIPVDIEGGESILRNGAVSFLLRILRVAEEGFPFAQVTALLRSNYFQPNWPELSGELELPSQSEALLRMLGEPRGRDAFLNAVARWADNPPPLLEDEQAEESRRQRVHERAKKCRPFLVRFFKAWENTPGRAALRSHVAWLRNIAEEFGVDSAVANYPRDRAALARLWLELDRWQQLQEKLSTEPNAISRTAFYRLLHLIANESRLARTPRGSGRVRVLSAPLARGLSASHLFVIGLGEGSFPQSAIAESLFDEPQRQSLYQAGLKLPSLSEMVPEEMLLFYQLVTTPTRQMTLSYAAVDDKGQELLPSSFLSALTGCFETNAISVQRRNMLIEGFDTEKPVSMAEYRIQAACCQANSDKRWPLPDDLSEHLTAAAKLADDRFHSKDHGIYDGLLADDALIEQIARQFSPDKILSPTALESFIVCPFKFYVNHVLKLETLEDPKDEIESTDRGLVFHRALSRLHTELRSKDVDRPTEDVEEVLMEQLGRAVNESNTQASAAADVLWQLEGQRLKKFGLRYPDHWRKFQSLWKSKKIAPRPEYFEAGFGLPAAEDEQMADALIIKIDDVEVRISGRIDRVDIADLPDENAIGFWVIDYKTGSSNYYTSKSLKEFTRLQLTLYALAAQEVLFGDRKARPLGLAYWMVMEDGANLVLPGNRNHLDWLEEPANWEKYASALRHWIVELVSHIRSGQFPLKPRSEDCTKTCDFSEICRISQSRQIVEEKSWQLPLPVI